MSESLIIKMRKYQTYDEPDELGRLHVGYQSSMSEQEIYESAKGLWVLDPRRFFTQVTDIYITPPDSDDVILHIKPHSLHSVDLFDKTKFYFEGMIMNRSEMLGQTLSVNTSLNSVKYIDNVYLEQKGVAKS